MKRRIWTTAISAGILSGTLIALTLVACNISLALPEVSQSPPAQNLIQTFSTPTTPNDQNSNGKILIMDQFNYYLANPDGSEQVLLYSGGGQIKMASLSPDGTKFAYFMGNYVYIQDIKTGKTITLNHEIIGSSGMGQIRWSPDGTHLAITCAKAGQPTFAICLIDMQNGQIEVLVNEKNSDEICSSNALELRDWSQDGSTMVYSCGIVPEQVQKPIYSTYLYNLGSKTSKRVLNGTTRDGIWGFGSASLSPDKKYLLITGHHQDYILQVFLLDLLNNTLKQMTNETDYDSEALVWKSDSRSFYLHRTYRQIPYPESNFVMDIHGRILNSMEINGRILK